MTHPLDATLPALEKMSFLSAHSYFEIISSNKSANLVLKVCTLHVFCIYCNLFTTMQNLVGTPFICTTSPHKILNFRFQRSEIRALFKNTLLSTIDNRQHFQFTTASSFNHPTTQTIQGRFFPLVFTVFSSTWKLASERILSLVLRGSSNHMP